MVVDGSYTNKNMLRHLPASTTLIGRIRKDARLRAKPGAPAQAACGPKRIYGDALPTPEQIRQDDKIPWIAVQARVNGKERSFEIKTIGPIRWRAVGEQDLRLVVIRPVGYQKRQGARKSYTQPAYLICTDAELPLEDLIQQYIWRWDIEVNHRDEKTILGVGQAQMRNEHSVETIPATAVAAYAMLQLAAIKAYGQGGDPGKKSTPRPRTSSMNCAGHYGRRRSGPSNYATSCTTRARALSHFKANPTCAAPCLPPPPSSENQFRSPRSTPRCYLGMNQSRGTGRNACATSSARRDHRRRAFLCSR